MSIDWFTVVAQVINFLVLVWILKKLLYQKILDILAERRQKVFKELKDAEDAKCAAEALTKEYAEKLNKLEEENARILQAAKEKVAAERERVLMEAQNEANVNRQKWVEALNREKEEFSANITSILVKKIGDLVRNICYQLNGEELASHSLEAFFNNFRNIDDERLQKLNQCLENNNGVLTFITSAPIANSLCEKLSEQMKQCGVKALKVIDYEVEESLILGVEIRVGSTIFSWSVRDYLCDFDIELKKLITKD